MDYFVGALVPPFLTLSNDPMTSEPARTPYDCDAWPDLIRAVAEQRDRAVFTTLFDHFAPRVKAYLRRLGLDDARAEDLMQEVMLCIWQRAGGYEQSQAALSTWVFTIARNKRIDLLRRERRPEVDHGDPALVPDPQPPAFDQEMLRQQQRHLQAALAALPLEQAEVVRLNFFEDKPHAAIAEMLGVPLGTVKSRVKLALAKLRQTLSKMD